MITIRSWFGLLAAVAHHREMPSEEAAIALGMPHFRGRYGFGAVIGVG